MSGISAILRGDCWTELMLTAFADGRDGSQLQKPYAGLSVKTEGGAADLVFQTVEAGTVQQDKLLIQNSGSGTATLRGMRCMPERTDGAISIVCKLPEGGALMPAGSSYQIEVHSTAPPVVGLHYTFVLALLEVEEHTDRALVSSRVLVGARACLMVTDPEGMAALNPEAPAFWPARLRLQWSALSLKTEAPPWSAPPWKRELTLQLPPGNSALLPEAQWPGHEEQMVAQWEAAAVQLQAELAEAERSLLDGAIGLLDGGSSGRADSARSVAANPYMIETPARLARQQLREQWEASHARLHFHLLMLEELKMQQDYEKLDAYFYKLTVHKQRRPPRSGTGGAPRVELHLEATISGLEEHQPPVMAGDTVRLRHDTEPGVEVGLRVVNVVNRTTLVMSADETMLRHVSASLLSHGRPDVFAPLLHPAVSSMGQIKHGASRYPTCPHVACKERRPHLCHCHLRFTLNRKPMQFMRHLLCMQHVGVERQRQLRTLREAHLKGKDDGRKNIPKPIMVQINQVAKYLPDIVPLLPTEADLLPTAAAAAVASASAAADTTAATDRPIQPIQPQLNALQRSAVQDVVSHRHGGAPYIVFGPPGTGKTMVMLECVLQALLLHPDPRLLVCAPSNAAADVLALRLLEQLPQLAARMQATRDADVAADANVISRNHLIDTNAGNGNSDGNGNGNVAAAVAADEAEAAEGAGSPAAIEWVCSSCTLLNAWSSALCDACGARISAEENARLGRALAEAEARTQAAREVKALHAAAAAATADANLALLPSSRRRWYQDEKGNVASTWASGGGGEILRLNAQQRVGTPVELMKICAQDAHSDHFTVPSISALAKKRVVICTCGAAHLLLEAGYPSSLWQATSPERLPPLPRFTHLLIDEASQALEPEMMLPLALATRGAAAASGAAAAPGCNVVLSGDHMQLGPVVRAPFCREKGLARSLLERLMALPVYSPLSSSSKPESGGFDGFEEPPASAATRGRCVTKLLSNYRSHGALLTLPSRLFYDNQLVEAADAGVTGALTAWDQLPTRGLPLLVYGLEGLQCHEHDSPSFFNPPEALKVAQLIEALLAKGAVDGTEISTGDIGVVAPFRKQVQKLREMLRERGLAAVNVGTVDDYQGQEKRVLFISTVLTHNIKQHHLVFNPKRFNVAVTRAKALLVVVGNPLAMLDDPSWRALLTHAVELSAYRGCPHPLMMEGAEEDLDDTVTRMTEITQLASRALGAGNLSAMYPSLSGNQDSQYSEYDDLPWRVML